MKRGRKPGTKVPGKYNLAFLDVGESKVIPLEGSGKRDLARLRRNVAVTACRRRDMRFTTMILPHGIYVRREA